MIKELTKEQEKKIKVYLKNGEAIGYRTKTVDKKKATKAVNFIYEKIMKIDKPKHAEHHTQKIAVGQYFLSPVMEYDHAKEESRIVID